ncbi:hypothetical protein AAMO2058_001114000 [Amorphochlora amoebiformis]
MLSSQMYFDKPSGADIERTRGRTSQRSKGRSRRTRADSIPRHGATDPADKYYGAQASYFGKQKVIYSEEESHGVSSNSGDAFWDIYADPPQAHTSTKAKVKSSSGHGGGGGAYWDIYDDQPSYKGPSYRDLRVKKTKGTEGKKGYEMRRSAPIDSPHDMIGDVRSPGKQVKMGSAQRKSTGGDDLQKPSVQKTVRPDHGLSFSRWDGDQSNTEYSFLAVSK